MPDEHTQPAEDRPPKRWRIARAVLKRVVLLAAVVLILRLTGCMEGLFYHPTAGPTPPPPGAEGVWFESDDGTRLFGWWIPAIDPGTEPAPTVLHVHGNAGNIESHAWFTEHLPDAGFNVFVFDYRGYGQSEGSPRRRGPLVADTHAALDAVLAREDVDADRVGVYGQSLGGSIAVNVLAERPELRAAVLESPFASWRGVAASALGGDPPGPIARFLAWLFIPDSHSPAEAIRTVDRPILILHGEADTIVPPSHGRRLAEAAGENAEFVTFEGGGHNTLKEAHPEVERLMIDFFRRTLSPAD